MNKDKITWEDVFVAGKSYGETYKNDLPNYRRFVKRMGYTYFIWNGKVMKLIDRGVYLTHEETDIKLEEL